MKQNLEKFFGDPDWQIVEEMLIDAVKDLSYAPNSATNPTDFKAQVLANQKLRDGIYDFLSQTKLVNREIIKKSVWE